MTTAHPTLAPSEHAVRAGALAASLPPPGQPRRAVRARGLTLAYDDEAVLRDVSLDLVPGSAPVGVIGASGSGKTSLVRLLAGWARATAGTVAFGDLDPHSPPRRWRRHVGAAVRGVAEEVNPVQAERETGRRVLDRRLRAARRTGRGPILDAEELCQLTGLPPENLDRGVMRSMSFGEQQRLAMASALATDPDVLILDEPATALDPASTARVTDAVVGYAIGRGTAVMVVSHDLAMISRLAPDDVMVLADGRQVARGPLAALLARPAHPYIAELAEIWAAEAATRRPVAATGGRGGRLG
jgi:ABC-type glutathione transport system ATPase component